jgi:hypothetical protein
MPNEKPKAYVVRMSIKNGDIKIDVDEVGKVIQGIASGQPVLVRQGCVNPSFYVAIVEDVDRLKSYYEEINRIKAENDGNKRYGFNNGQQKALPEFTPLRDIFSGVQLLNSGSKKLTA